MGGGEGETRGGEVLRARWRLSRRRRHARIEDDVPRRQQRQAEQHEDDVDPWAERGLLRVDAIMALALAVFLNIEHRSAAIPLGRAARALLLHDGIYADTQEEDLGGGGGGERCVVLKRCFSVSHRPTGFTPDPPSPPASPRAP
jgi:hypothetical protein